MNEAIRNLTTKPNFCVLPFIHLSASPTSIFRLCCIARKNQAIGGKKHMEWASADAREFWESEYMRDIRKRMLYSSESIDECNQCAVREKTSKKSKRIDENQRWINRSQTKQRIADAMNNDGIVTANPIYLDLKMGNLCNLKCRMCNPVESSQWHTELKKHQSEWKGVLNFDRQMNYADSMTQWYRTKRFNSDIESMFEDLRHIYVTGGEPTIIPELKVLLEKLSLTPHCDHISIRFNTNATQVSDTWIRLLSRFKRVTCSLSIDAYGQRNSWLRSPSNWDDVQRSVSKYCALNAKLRLNSVVSVYNILYIDEMIQWRKAVEAKWGCKIQHKLTLLLHPRYMSAALLPAKLKQQALAKIEAIPDPGCDLSALKLLLESPQKEDADLLKRLKTQTKMIDKWRNEDYLKVFPDLGFIEQQ